MFNISKYLKNKYNIILFVIFFIALTIRIAGVYPGYTMDHPDEGTIAVSALRITFAFDFIPVGYYYGQLLPIIYALINWIFILPVFILFIYPLKFISPPFTRCLQSTETLQYCFSLQNKIFWDYIGRFETAFLSAFVVFFVYLVGKRIFNKDIGIIAAILTAVNYRHVLSSIFSLADSPVSVFALISVLLSINIIKNNNLKNYIFAGAGIALVLSTKYFIYTIPAFLICHTINTWKNNNGGFFQKIFVAAFATVALFLAINPHLIIDYPRASYQLTLNAARYGLSAVSLKDYFSNVNIYQLYYLYKFAFGPVIITLIIIGFVLGLIKKPLGTIIVSSVALPVLAFLLFRGTPVRNYTAIVPFLLFFPAIVIYYFSKLIKKLFDNINLKISIVSMCIFFAIIFGFFGLKNSLSLVKDMSKTHNSQLLTDWILKNIPEDNIVVSSYGAHPPRFYISNGIVWTPSASSYTSFSELLSTKIQWVVFSSSSSSSINELRWIPNMNIVKQIFFNDQKLEIFLRDTYSNLVTGELYKYTVVEFSKNSNLSPESNYFVSKLPLEKFERVSNKIISQVYFNNSKTNNVTLTYQKNDLPNNDFFITNKSEISKFNTNPNHLYTIKGLSKFSTYNIVDLLKDGYLRLDFYDETDKLLSSHVSGLTSNNNNWNNLVVYGISPIKSKYATISFQIDTYQNKDTFSVMNIKVNESIKPMTEVINDYKYLNETIPLMFLKNGSF